MKLALPPRLRGMRRRSLVAGLVAVVLLLGAGGAWLLTRETSSAAVAATTATVSTETVRTTVSATGTLAAARTADLSFAVGGRVTQVLVEEGDHVRRGQALARVDRTALVAARTAAATSLEASLAQLDEDLDAGASDVQVAADRTAVVAARAALAEARTAVEDATLTATIDGTVTSLDLAVGDTVSASGGSGGSGGSGASGGSAASGSPSAALGSGTGASTTSTSATTSTAATTAQVSIASTGSFVVEATVATADVASLKKGLQAEIAVAGVEDTVYGTVTDVGLVARTASSGAAVFPVTVTVTGKRDDLYAGTTADVTIIVAQTAGVLTVDTRALRTEGGTTYVEKLVDGDVVRTTVEVGAAHGATTEVVSGLADGDVVQVPGFAAGPGGGQGGDLPALPDGFPEMPGGAPGGMPGGVPGGFPGGGR